MLEEIGRAVIPRPLLRRRILASLAIQAGGTAASRSYLPKIATGELKATVAVLEDRSTGSPRASSAATKTGASYA